MRRLLLLTGLVACGPVLLVASVAWAYFFAHGSGHDFVGVGSLAAPTAVSGAPAGGVVTVTWSEAAAPPTGTVGFYVTRTPLGGGITVEVCGSPSVPLPSAPTSCTDQSAPVGQYTYSVTALYTSWASVSAPSTPVTVGKASTTTALSVSSPFTTYGDESEVTFAAAVTPQIGVVPTGTVTVVADATDLCTITLPATTCSTADTTLGASSTAWPVTALYGGDGEYTASDSTGQPLVVGQDSTTASVAAVPDTVTTGYEGSTDLEVAVTTGHGEELPAAGEHVTVDVGTTSCDVVLAPQPGGGAGRCAIGASDLAVSGTPYSVSTAYGGDDDLEASTPVTSADGLTVVVPPTITTTSLDAATQSETDYSQVLNVTGGSAPCTWSVVSGSLPAGLALDPDAGVIAGDVDPAATTQTFTVEVTDQSGATAQAVFTLTVYPLPVITTSSLADAVAAETGYVQDMSATGGAPALGWAVTTGVLPYGLSIDPVTGTISGTLSPGSTSQTFTVTVTDANGLNDSRQFTLVVTSPFVRQAANSPVGNADTFKVNLPNGVTAGDALVLTLGQACTDTSTIPATAVDSHVTGVSGDSVTWIEAESTGCTADGDAEVWYGLDAPVAGTNTKITVDLNAVAAVQYVDVAEFSGLSGVDSAAGASESAEGNGTSVSPGTSTPTGAGELVMSAAYVQLATPTSLTGLVDPFAPLTLVSPFRGFGAYVIDATAAPRSYDYAQLVGGVPTAGAWSAAAATFTLGP